MPPGRSSDSLRAVLLSAKSQSGSGSKPGSSALTWHSLKSVGPSRITDPPGHYFPAKLALAMGLVKIFFSLSMMGLGAIAVVMKASISSIGAGVWVGVIVGVSGFLGVCAARRPYIHVYVMSFMSVSILSLAASGLLIVLSATAWAKDNRTPHRILYDLETQSEVDFFGEFLNQRPSILVSGLLVVLGVFDILISLACVALSAREACGTNSPHMGVFAVNDGHDKKERLYRWLGQQKNIFHVSSTSNGPKNIASVSQFVPMASSSSSTHRKSSSALSPSSEPLQNSSKECSPGATSGNSGSSSALSSDVVNDKRPAKSFKSSSGVSSSKKNNSSVVIIHPEVDYDLKEPFLVKRKQKTKPLPLQQPFSLPNNLPLERHHHNRMHGGSTVYPNYWAQYVALPQQENLVHASQGPVFHSLPCPQHQFYAHHPTAMYYHPQYNQHTAESYVMHEKFPTSEEQKLYKKNEKKKEKNIRKKREEKRKRREEREIRKSRPLTDKQIEKSYTGLDREIAEGFISLAMEPSFSRRKSRNSTSDDSF